MSKLQVSIYKGAAANGVRLSREDADAIAYHLTCGYAFIPRAETCDGEVKEDELGVAVSAGSGPEFAVGSTTDNPNWLRNRAINLLAIADYVENRDEILATKEAEATAARNKRRDELAEDIFSAGYTDLTAPAKNAINRIIDLEQAA